MSEELELTGLADEALVEKLADAVDNASDQGRSTWLTCHGKRVAAIVPVDVAEEDERRTEALLATPVTGPVARERAVLCRRLTELGAPALAGLIGSDPDALAQCAALVALAEAGQWSKRRLAL